MKRNRKNNRLKNYDYSQDGYYYVTICTKDHREYFNEILNDTVVLNEYGIVANDHWRDIPDHFDYAGLDEFVIMPNHIHGILIINTEINRSARSFSAQKPNKTNDNVSVDNRHACSLRRNHEKLPVAIGSFKSAVTRRINSMQSDFIFGWQKSFYDRVIRNEQELFTIRQYIRNNRLKTDF